MASFKIALYNCRGFTWAKLANVDSILQYRDILLVHEHWLLANDLSLLCNAGLNISLHGSYEMPENVVLEGRPYGIVVILWHNRINRLIAPYKQFNNRCCAVRMAANQLQCVIICMYLPTENYSAVISDDSLTLLMNLKFLYTLVMLAVF